MHNAFDSSPLLTGIKGKPESLIVHGAKLFVGTSTGSLSIYRIDQPHPHDAPSSSTSPSKPPSILSTRSSIREPKIPASIPVQTATQFSKRSIDQLGVIKEANLLVSLSDGYVSLHDLSTLELRSQLTQTKGATTFGIDTSIQKRAAPKVPDYGPGPLGGRTTMRGGGGKYNPNATIGSRAFRPGAIGDQTQAGAGGGAAGVGTVGRNRSSVYDVPSKDWQTASMRGMDAMVKYREEERRKAMEGARFGGTTADAEGQDGVMTLVTVLAIGVKRKLLVFRWVDGEFWDTREVALNHTPRSLAFVTPTRLLMGYNAAEYGTISIPLAAESTVAYTHPSSGYGGAGNGSSSQLRRETHVHPPANSTSGPLVDLTSPNLSSWHVEDFDLSSNNTVTPEGGDATGANQQSSGAGFGVALGGLGGLGGYMGLSSRGKMSVLHVDGGEVLFVRDGTGIFLGADGRPTRREGVEWSASPLEVAFAKPYVFSVLPSGSVPSLKNSSLPNANNPVLQIRSVGTLFAVQTLCFPPVSATNKPLSSSSSPPQVRLLTPSTGNKPPVFVVVTPTDRTALEREGSTIWQLEMQGWGRQIDELVEKGEFEEALGLLDSVDNVILEDKDERRAHVQGLFAVSLFADERYDEAVEMFMELDTNPAKVIALYPSSVAGELSRGREEWFPIFGGKTPVKLRAPSGSDGGDAASLSSPPPSLAALPTSAQALATSATSAARKGLGAFLPARRPQSIIGEPAGFSSLSSSPSQAGAIKPKPSRTATGATTATTEEADHLAETGSIRSVRTTREAPEMKATGSGVSRDSRNAAAATAGGDTSRKALEALGKFLADRRRIFKPILEASPHLESKDHMAMSQIKRDTHWLLSLPNKPFGEMDKDELIAVAQTVDTALFKTFLQTKPALIGPLCRIENWCEVEQVEELLKERKKFSELIALYGGKEMHSKALGLLKQFADDEDDVEEKMRPTIQYLQNLGQEFIDVILETSHWLLKVDSELGMEVFTADTGKVGSWPRLEIVDDFNRFDKELCAVYLEYIIDNAGEADPELHDKLIRLYLRRAANLREQLQSSATGEDASGVGSQSQVDGAEGGQSATPQSLRGEREELMQKLLKFLRSSTQYRPEQILVRLPADDDDRDMLEARALLLGRMGQHEGALSIYVRKLQDPTRAEEYCRDVWRYRAASAPRSSTSNQAQQQQQQQRLEDGRSNHQQSLLIDQEQKQRADQEVFLTLLRIYLDTSSSTSIQLDAALGLIERHAARIDLRSALDLLPSTVPLTQIAGFVNVNLCDLTRKQHEARVIREIRTNRNWQVEETLCKLQSRRVKVGESRTCPKCHKRLGNSVVAVNPVSGAVMHYFCSIHAEQKGQQRPS